MAAGIGVVVRGRGKSGTRELHTVWLSILRRRIVPFLNTPPCTSHTKDFYFVIRVFSDAVIGR